MKDIVNPKSYAEMLTLQKSINEKLLKAYNENINEDREYLSNFLIKIIYEIIDDLNNHSHKFGRCDYSGDINFENSEQTYSDGKEMGTGIIIHFHGFSAQVSWEGTDRYYQ